MALLPPFKKLPRLALLSLQLNACALSRMAVPEELRAKTEALPVTKKKFRHFLKVQRMNFGSFVASDFNPGPIEGGTPTEDGYTYSAYQQRYGS